MLFEVKYDDYINAVNQDCMLQPSGESHVSGLHGIFTHVHIHMHIIKNNKKRVNFGWLQTAILISTILIKQRISM